MATVMNTSSIIPNIEQYYYNKKLFCIWHDPIKVTKLAAIAPQYYHSSFQQASGISGEYAYAEQGAYEVGNKMYDSFSIAPTKIYFDLKSKSYDCTTKKGIKLEWIPVKELYICKMTDYIDLYNSFAEYLEVTTKYNINICFYPLYLSKFKKTAIKRNETPLSFDDYFETRQMTAYTSNGIFKADSETLRFDLPYSIR